jgi:TM2 domain-containing membrane protein YozV
MPDSVFCPACGAAYAGDARFCASCGRPRADLAIPEVPPPPPSAPGPTAWPPPPVGSQPPVPVNTAWPPPVGSQPLAGTQGTKSRPVAAFLALILGSLGIHKFYLGKVGLGVLYLLFFWTYIPGVVGWIEGILYLRMSDEAWARERNQPVVVADSTAIGCLWVLAIGPFILGILAIVAIVSLIFLGGQVSTILSRVGESV